MAGEVVRLCDYEKRSREPDAEALRDPADTAVIIVMPIIRVERFEKRDAAS